MMLLSRWSRLDGLATAHVLHDERVPAVDALTKNMHAPEAAMHWAHERTWFVPDGLGRTTAEAMRACGVGP